MKRIIVMLAICPLLTAAAEPLAISDPRGDVEGKAALAAAFLDLELVTVEVAATELIVGWSFVGWETDAPALATPVHMWVEFSFRDEMYRIAAKVYTAKVPPDQDHLVGGIDASLLRLDPGGWTTLSEARVERNQAMVTVTVGLAAIRTQQELFPQPGQTILLHDAASFWSTEPEDPHDPPSWTTGHGRHTDTVAIGDVALSVPGADADITLATAHPIRFSNGEATTFHWLVEVGNLRRVDATLSLSLDVDGALESHVPPAVKVPAGATRGVNVFVTVPFAHAHGSATTFVLRAEEEGEATELLLGIEYPAIPQPAGHHRDLFLHARADAAITPGAPGSGAHAWMNTRVDDPSADAESILPRSDTIMCVDPSGQEDGQMGLEWWFPLAPDLKIGLDGRIDEKGLAEVVLHSDAYIPPGALYGLLVMHNDTQGPGAKEHFGPDIRLYPFTEAVAVSANVGAGSQSLTLPVALPTYLDRVAPTESANLVLAIVYCAVDTASSPYLAATATGSHERPLMSLSSGGHVILPLDEYHDVIAIPASSDDLRLAPESVERAGKPGARVAWNVTAHVPEASAYVARILGGDGLDPQIVAGQRIGGSGAHRIVVAADVPSMAREGDTYSFVLELVDETEPASSVAVRLVVRVDPSLGTDDSAWLENLGPRGRDSPSVPLGALMLGLLLLLPRRP